MNYFVSKMLNNAFEQVESSDDAEALAKVVIDLSQDTINDRVWKHLEQTILTLLIQETCNNGAKRNFSNIVAMLRSDCDTALDGNQIWLELKRATTKNFLDSAIMDLEVRLSPLRVLSKVS